MDSSNTFSTSTLVNGKVYASDYTDPTPVYMTTAISDMETAYTTANGQTTPDATELNSGDIGGMTLAPGLYKWSTGVTIPTDVTLNAMGNTEAVWVFQIAGTLVTSPSTHVILTNGTQSKNVFWVVADQTTLGTGSVFSGNILDQTAIVFDDGAALNGRALAQTAVTLIGNTVDSTNVQAPLAVAPPTVSSAETNADGTLIMVTFSKAMNSPAGNVENFTYQLNNDGNNLAFDTAVLNGTSKIYLTTSGTSIASGDVVNVSYVAGTVTATDGGVLANFDRAVTNNVPADPAMVALQQPWILEQPGISRF